MQNPDAARLNHSLSDERLEKTRAMTRVTVHPSSMWLSQTVQLILWLGLSGWRRHHVLSVRQVKHPMGSTGMRPSHFTSLFFSCLQPVGKNKSEQDTITFNVLYIYTHNFIYGMYYVYIYIYVCVCKIRQSVVAKRSICMLVSGMASCSCQDPIWPCGLGVFCHIYPRMPCVFW